MANLINPESGRTFVHETCLGTLMEWTQQRRIVKAMWLSTRVEADPRSLGLLANAVAQTCKDKTGGGLPEESTIKLVLTFLEDPKVMRIIARAEAKLKGTNFKVELAELRQFQAEIKEMVRPGPIILH